MKNLYIGIETSCDDTSICVMKRDKIIFEKTISSASLQQKYGGVVPELASREHLKNIHIIFNELKNNINIKNIKCIFCTNTPGLPGSLHVGIFFAKSLSKLLNIPMYNINHLYGHIFSCFINHIDKISFPFLSLIVSGGNTILYLVNDYNDVKVLNETADDAVGEVYDKIGRALGLKYPCGPEIDHLFNIEKATISFLKHQILPSEQFSFSGLKTAVLNYINHKKIKNETIDVITIASSFQKEVINLLKIRIDYYINKYHHIPVYMGGGVSANKYLRLTLNELNPNLMYPEIKYTGDNATMICFYGYLLLKNKKVGKKIYGL